MLYLRGNAIGNGESKLKTKAGFSWGNFLRNLAVIAIPVALQNLLTTTGSMVDTMMIAPLGETFVGAVGLCAQFSSLMFSGYWGFVGGGMLFFSQYWGAKDEDGCPNPLWRWFPYWHVSPCLPDW